MAISNLLLLCNAFQYVTFYYPAVPDKTCIMTEPFIDSCNLDCKVICSLTDTGK